MPEMKQAAVFLDRDGTINEEVGYLDDLGKLRIIPQAVQAIRLINGSGMLAVVVTNQSGVARGYFTEAFVVSVHARLQELLQERGAHLDAFLYCPHHPTEGTEPYRTCCLCRKPAAGMLQQAAGQWEIDLARSYMIGDTLNDMAAAEKAGVKGVLVRTGYGRDAERDLAAAPVKPVHIAADILAAVSWIMRDRVT